MRKISSIKETFLHLQLFLQVGHGKADAQFGRISLVVFHQAPARDTWCPMPKNEKANRLKYKRLAFCGLSYADSNHDKQNQNLLCYHYTIRQSFASSNAHAKHTCFPNALQSYNFYIKQPKKNQRFCLFLSNFAPT